MGTSAALNAKRLPGWSRCFTRSLALAFTTIALISCSGGDGDQISNPSSASPQQTVDPTPAPDTSLPVDKVTEAKKAELTTIVNRFYDRPYEYSHMVNLPLQFVPMSNGKKLSVRVTLPANEKGVPAPGPFPVILTQSGYNTNLLSLMFFNTPGNLMLGAPDYFMVQRGYAQVAVDVLGTGASEGGWELLGEDEQQGYADMVDWVHQQPWANGKLGVAGVSYMAISSLFAAQRRPDTVHAVFASLPIGDAMRGIVGTGGLLNTHFMRTWMYITHTLATQNVPVMAANPQHMNQLLRSTNEHVDQIDSFFLPLVDDALWNEPYVTYYGDFWEKRSPLVHMDKIKAPTFIFGALVDLFQRDAPLLFEKLQQNGVDSRMVIYNGFHLENFIKAHIGNEEVPAIDYLMLQWFDHYLRGMDTGVEDIPTVVQHVKNYPSDSTPEERTNDSYITASAWPHPLAKPERWYLRGDQSLTKTAPVEVESHHYMTNPEHPNGRAYRKGGLLLFEVEINDDSKCSRSYHQWMLGIDIPRTCTYNTNKSKQQRLVFETAPMEQDYFINGPIQADIWIESTAAEAVVVVQLEEISEKQSMPFTNGQLLASVRAVDTEKSRYLDGEMIQPYHYFTEEKAELLVPGEVVKMQIEIFPTSTLIRKGNKLRVVLSPSNQVQGMLNFPRQDLADSGVTTIHISDEYPSSVVMPIVPLGAMN